MNNQQKKKNSGASWAVLVILIPLLMRTLDGDLPPVVFGVIVIAVVAAIAFGKMAKNREKAAKNALESRGNGTKAAPGRKTPRRGSLRPRPPAPPPAAGQLAEKRPGRQAGIPGAQAALREGSMRKTGITIVALILLLSFQLIDAIADQNWFQVRGILIIDTLLLAVFGITIIVDRWKRKRVRGKDENS